MRARDIIDTDLIDEHPPGTPGWTILLRLSQAPADPLFAHRWAAAGFGESLKILDSIVDAPPRAPEEGHSCPTA